MVTEFTLGFALATLSALSWALLDITRKKLGREMSAVGAVAGLMLLHILFINPVLLAGSITETPDSVAGAMILGGYPSLATSYFPPAFFSILLNLAANFLFLRAVQISPLSLTIPYLAFTPVFTAITALIFIGQSPSTAGALGILIVCLGAFFLNRGDDGGGLFAPVKALWTERGSLFMLIVALIWSVTPILDKNAADQTSPLFHTMFLAAGIGVIFTAIALGRDRSLIPLIKEFKKLPLWLCLGGLFAVGAMLFQLSSYAYIDVAYVETVKRGIGVTAAMIAGYFLFGERDILRRLVAAFVMVIGVALILIAG